VIAAAGQAILHATVAVLVIEGLLRLWRVEDPGERLAMRWLAMIAPAVLTPLYLAAAPWRALPWFTDRWALFAGVHWNQLRLGGAGVASACAVLCALLGTMLYLRDAVPFVADRLLRQAPEGGLPDGHPACARVRAALDSLPEAGSCRPGTIAVVHAAAPILLCSGVDRTAIIISTGTLDRLDDGALRGALAHEIAHLAARDPLMGWWLMAARTLQFFNPVVQIVARQAIQDLERRADMAVTARGLAPELASAVHRLSLAADLRSDLSLPAEGEALASGTIASAHRRAIDDRCQLLLEAVLPAAQPHRAVRVGLTGMALTVLLFLVV
jgi:Zn-dependent protease with chaperone function